MNWEVEEEGMTIAPSVFVVASLEGIELENFSGGGKVLPSLDHKLWIL